MVRRFGVAVSTIVEIYKVYMTSPQPCPARPSTIVEIYKVYMTKNEMRIIEISTIVEIYKVYITLCCFLGKFKPL